MRLAELQPPNRRLAMIEGSVILGALLFTAFRILLIVPSGAADAAPLPPTQNEFDPVSKEDRTTLLERFASKPASTTEQLGVMSRMTQEIERLDLTLDSRTLQSPAEEFPPRQNHRLVVSGSAAQLTQFMSYLMNCTDPIRVRDLIWDSGPNSKERLLDVLIEILVE